MTKVLPSQEWFMELSDEEFVRQSRSRMKYPGQDLSDQEFVETYKLVLFPTCSSSFGFTAHPLDESDGLPTANKHFSCEYFSGGVGKPILHYWYNKEEDRVQIRPVEDHRILSLLRAIAFPRLI